MRIAFFVNDVQTEKSGYTTTRLAYTATNRGHDSLACFRIAPSGALEGAGVFPTETTPRSFHWDPAGRFLYAAGEGNDRLSLYRVDPDDGALERLCTYVTGRVPWWVQVVAPTS